MEAARRADRTNGASLCEGTDPATTTSQSCPKQQGLSWRITTSHLGRYGASARVLRLHLSPMPTASDARNAVMQCLGCWEGSCQQCVLLRHDRHSTRDKPSNLPSCALGVHRLSGPSCSGPTAPEVPSSLADMVKSTPDGSLQDRSRMEITLRAARTTTKG